MSNQIVKKENDVVNIKFKPKYSTYILLLCSIVMLLSLNIKLMIFGIICLLVSIYVIKQVKDTVKASIYEDRITLYNANETLTINYSDIAEWNTQDNKIFIRKNDGSVVSVDTYDTIKAHRVLQKYLSDLESFSILKNTMKNRKK